MLLILDLHLPDLSSATCHVLARDMTVHMRFLVMTVFACPAMGQSPEGGGA